MSATCSKCTRPVKARGLCGTHYQQASKAGELHLHATAERPPLIDRTLGKTCPPDHKHGQAHTCYNTHGCRCRSCRTAKSRHRNPYEWETRRRVGRDVWVPAAGTVRRLRALAVMGWPISAIAAETNLFHRSLGKVREGSRARVHLSTHQAVSAVFERFSMQYNTTRAGRITRTRALAKGWLPPLAWDDVDRDRRAKGVAA